MDRAEMKRGKEAKAIERIAAIKDLSVKPDLIDLAWRTGVGFLRLEHLVTEERLRRGDITLADLKPHERRAHVDVGRLDLHAIANGPIMQPDSLYLPAGRVTMEEARRREAANLRVGDPA